jgi:hypothetical protein
MLVLLLLLLLPLLLLQPAICTAYLWGGLMA